MSWVISRVHLILMVNRDNQLVCVDPGSMFGISTDVPWNADVSASHLVQVVPDGISQVHIRLNNLDLESDEARATDMVRLRLRLHRDTQKNKRASSDSRSDAVRSGDAEEKEDDRGVDAVGAIALTNESDRPSKKQYRRSSSSSSSSNRHVRLSEAQATFLSDNTCCICSDLMDDVACLDCREHRFCHTCVQKALVMSQLSARSTSAGCCPLCRHPQPSGKAIRVPEATAKINVWLEANPGLVDLQQRAHSRLQSLLQLQGMYDDRRERSRINFIERRLDEFERLSEEGHWIMERPTADLERRCRCYSCDLMITQRDWRLSCQDARHRSIIQVHLGCICDLGTSSVIGRLRTKIRPPNLTPHELIEVRNILNAAIASRQAERQVQQSALAAMAE